MKRRLALAAALVGLGFALAAPAPACTEITSVPYTINSPGNYCLASNLTYFATSGTAISVNTGWVTIDLGGYTMESASTPSSTSIGVYAYEESNVVVKNGTIRGFFQGVRLDAQTGSTQSLKHHVENVTFENCLYQAIKITGSNVVIRSNVIQLTGGTSVNGTNSAVTAITLIGREAIVKDNSVTGFVPVGTGGTYGIYLNSYAAVVEGNIIGPGNSSSYGITVANSQNVFVVNNRLNAALYGVYFSSSTGKYRDNLTSGVTVPYYGGTDAGGNN